MKLTVQCAVIFTLLHCLPASWGRTYDAPGDFGSREKVIAVLWSGTRVARVMTERWIEYKVLYRYVTHVMFLLQYFLYIPIKVEKRSSLFFMHAFVHRTCTYVDSSCFTKFVPLIMHAALTSAAKSYQSLGIWVSLLSHCLACRWWRRQLLPA